MIQLEVFCRVILLLCGDPNAACVQSLIFDGTSFILAIASNTQ